ncbi:MULTISPECIES: omptin family outer membrane protease [unclassified Chelatococcus]|uniref:omptin family outer membrane protease n=1 Tax=unclassified Chelatococcus TaxID=2638111 RepID=UPI001BCC8D45|nr:MULTISPECIES: omptin family outer membrane protease [unclassified Chelatococcus]MBS7698206.1 omptin family outer membrane protease [Chelatococcus sp. YT9]MBX3559874.1 omptin family outer membrane protease [Chelatococcus sp.]
MISLLRHIVLAMLLVPAGVAQARDVEATRQADFKADRWHFSVYSGYLTGQATELLFDGDAKASQLNWQIDKALVLGGSASFSPLDWLTLSLGAWTGVAHSGAVDDFDWSNGYAGFESWTDWSNGRTTMPRAVQLDLNLAARLWEHAGFRLSVLGGYKELHFKWKDYGGSFVYSHDGFRDETGVISDDLGITYRQDWHIPYMGLRAQYEFARWSLSVDLTGSLFGWGSAVDHHIYRALVSPQNFRDVRMIGASLAAEYRLADNFSLVAKADYQRVGEGRGSVALYGFDRESDDFGFDHCRDCAGASLEMAIFSVGLKASW